MVPAATAVPISVIEQTLWLAADKLRNNMDAAEYKQPEMSFMAQLTKQEKQDIIRHLEADKPLPDKYRFIV